MDEGEWDWLFGVFVEFLGVGVVCLDRDGLMVSVLLLDWVVLLFSILFVFVIVVFLVRVLI